MQVRQQIISDGKLWLSPLDWGDIGFVRADDGFGVYAQMGEKNIQTDSVAFLFGRGKIRAIDTGMMAIDSGAVFFGDLERVMGYQACPVWDASWLILDLSRHFDGLPV